MLSLYMAIPTILPTLLLENTSLAADNDCFLLMLHLRRWCQGKTMREAGFVLKHLEEYCRKHPIQLLKLAAAPDRALAAADSKAWQPS